MRGIGSVSTGFSSRSLFTEVVREGILSLFIGKEARCRSRDRLEQPPGLDESRAGEALFF